MRISKRSQQSQSKTEKSSRKKFAFTIRNRAISLFTVTQVSLVGVSDALFCSASLIHDSENQAWARPQLCLNPTSVLLIFVPDFLRR
ncbi:hypothetical protein L596_014155 [Steinernema carpocapsae]|uniref:Uncharacterized protein n=1 Tax=Steinernema carpocapsae TaxID=34508 RepID=A0A4U5NAV0_STECR|nr:hypothetical protein L596_014155 [Steinernema carpocapsae]